MTDADRDNTHPDSPPLATPDDGRSDLEQAVSARADAVARGEGGVAADDDNGTGGAGGVVKNQDETAQ